MALGDGTSWDETSPSNSTNLSDGDDHIRDVRKGVRIRMEKEHNTFGSSSAGGEHTFVTLQNQASKPTLSGSQIAAIYAKTVSGIKELFYEDSAGTEVQLTTAGAINVAATPAVPTGSVFPWGGAIASPPTGYLICDGSAVSRTTYSALFAICGTIWGSGDGSTTFNLPNFVNKFPYGASEGSSAGNASVGQTGGRTPAGNDSSVTAASGTPSAPATEGTTNPTASSSTHTHDVMPPYIAISWIIKT